MVTEPSLRDALAAEVRRNLLPQRFPVRRDIELSSAVGEAPDRVFFVDHMWLDEHSLAATGGSIRGSGLEAALEAASLRQLLRALLTVVGRPPAVIAALKELSDESAFDVALARIDTLSGEIELCAHGNASVSLAGAPPPSSLATLRPDDLVWIAAGGFPPPPAAIPPDGLDGIVRAHLRATKAGAACAVLLKAHARQSRSATFVMANEHGEIPALLSSMNRFFARNGIDNEEVAGIDVALDEILTNAVSYGFGDGVRHEIVVAATATDKCVLVEVRDDGAPFDPLSVAEPDLSADLDQRQVGGLGMHFVRTLLDKVSYSRANGWNTLRLEKNLKKREGRPGVST